MENHPFGTLALTSFMVNDCSEQERARIRAHVDACAQCRDLLARLAAERDVFLTRLPYSQSIGAARPVAPRRPAQLAYALAACLLVAITAIFFLPSLTTAPASRIKGDVAISIFVKTENDRIEKRAGSEYHPGEQIQIAYSSGQFDHLILLGIEGNGTITDYYPQSGDTSILIEKGQNLPLPNSILLDEYLGLEAYVAVFSPRPLSLSQTVKAIRDAYAENPDLSATQPALPADAVVKKIVITKTEKQQ
jgi:hypothetical protein